MCVCVSVCVHGDKKKDQYLFHSPSLTRVFIEWRCVSIDQLLLPCEHFYSPEEQQLTDAITHSHHEPFHVCACARNRKAFRLHRLSLCKKKKKKKKNVSLSLLPYLHSCLSIIWLPWVLLSLGGFLSSQRVMVGEIGVPWARSDTMYGIMCVGVWIALVHRHGNCFKSFLRLKSIEKSPCECHYRSMRALNPSLRPLMLCEMPSHVVISYYPGIMAWHITCWCK